MSNNYINNKCIKMKLSNRIHLHPEKKMEEKRNTIIACSCKGGRIHNETRLLRKDLILRNSQTLIAYPSIRFQKNLAREVQRQIFELDQASQYIVKHAKQQLGSTWMLGLKRYVIKILFEMCSHSSNYHSMQN